MAQLIIAFRRASSVHEDELQARNRASFDGTFGRLYSYWMERPWLGRAIGMVLWGGDAKPYYESMRAVGELPAGAVVVDAPCGAGAAFPALSPRQRVRYLALDLSPLMLERARARARSLGLDQIEFIEGDAERVPLEDDSVDLFLSYWGLHCMPHPNLAIREAARCLRGGGRLIGAMICRGPGLRQRLFIRPGVGAFGPGGTLDDLERWLVAAGLVQTRLEVSGPFAYFEASALSGDDQGHAAKAVGG
jgi:SAM-dependent methyltransferase